MVVKVALCAPASLPNPSSGSTGVLINVNPVISFNEPVQKTDGTPITNADLPSLVAFKTNNAGGADVPFTATINTAKTIMKLYKITANANPINGGTLTFWVGTQSDASAKRKTLVSDQGFKRADIITEEVDVPTDKQGLLGFLNATTAS